MLEHLSWAMSQETLEARGLLNKGMTALYKWRGLTIREEKVIGKVHTLAKKITKTPGSRESKQLQVF